MADFILGGLLSGIGRGIENNAIANREAALEALRRQDRKDEIAQQRSDRTTERQQDRDWQIEDQKSAEKLKTGLLALQHEYDMTELEVRQKFSLDEIAARGNQDRQTASHKGAIDAQLQAYKADDDKELENLRTANENEQVHSTDIAEDGSLVVLFKDGRKVRLKQKMDRGGSSGDDTDTGTIAQARQRREGTLTAKPRAPAKPEAKTLPNASTRDAPANLNSPAAKKAIEASAAQFVRQGSLGPGTQVGEKVTAPAGALAPEPVTLQWNGQRWIYVP